MALSSIQKPQEAIGIINSNLPLWGDVPLERLPAEMVTSGWFRQGMVHLHSWVVPEWLRGRNGIRKYYYDYSCCCV